MVEVNLITEDKAPQEVTFSRFAKTNIPFIGAALLLFLMGAAALGFFVYRSTLKSEIQKANKQIGEARTSIDENILSQMIIFDSQVVNLKKILDLHRDGSRLFGFLEENTLKRASYDSVSVNIETSELSVSGSAASYSILAKEMRHLESLPEISNVEVSGIKLSPDRGVSFSLTARISQEVFSYR